MFEKCEQRYNDNDNRSEHDYARLPNAPILRVEKEYILEQLYNLCSKNKGTDQLCSHCTADLRLCFCLCILLVLLCGGSYETSGSDDI